MGLFRRMGHGGDIIKRKLLLCVLLLFGLALILNVNMVSAVNVGTDHTQPKVTAVNPASNTIITNSKPIILTFSETIKAGSLWIELKDGTTSIPIKKSVSGNTLIITPIRPLKTSVKYNIVIHTNSITDLSGNSNSPYTSLFTVSSLTLVQMKDGLNRAQIFYNKNYRMPAYVSFGSKKIVIAEFQKIIATQGLKIKTINDNSASKNADTVTAKGWNSCCSGWYKTSGTFINYCPLCHSYTCLTYNPKHTPEGEWTCNKCDADYCICGRCKATGSNVHLITA
jgi:hypothetical protein